MEIKSRISDESMNIYKNIRFNENVFGPGKVFNKEIQNEDNINEKKYLGSLSILSLMTILGYYDDIKDAETKSSIEVVSEMLNKSSLKI